MTALTSLRVTNHTAATGHLVAYDPDHSQPGTSNINITTSDHTSNTVLSGSGVLSGGNYMYLRRDNSITATTSVSVVQMGFFS